MYKITAEDIAPYRFEAYNEEYDRYGYFSEFDKYEISEVLLEDPIRNKNKLIDEEEYDEERAFAEFENA